MAAAVAEIDVPTEHLEREVCMLAAQIAAATCQFLLLVAELDRREAWASWGCRSMAHWLSYRCGISLSTAREQVRVGRALDNLPEISAAFANGTVSYSKVRALVRVATPEAEADLVELAQVATGAQLERIVTAYVASGRDAATSQLVRRGLRYHTDDDGSLVVTLRLPADGRAYFLAALERALADIPADASADADHPIDARRADAFEVIVRSYVEGDTPRAPHTEVAVHADLATLGDDEHGETLRTLACDASLTLHVDANGKTRDVGRRKRTVPAALRQAIERRDRGRCRFPGCGNRRFLHAHHIVHFAHGGPTTADNLVLLCTFHHRLVHAGGWRVRGRAGGELTFTHADGRAMPERPAPPAPARLRRDPRFNAATIPMADGGRLDLDHAVTALVSRMRPHRN